MPKPTELSGVMYNRRCGLPISDPIPNHRESIPVYRLGNPCVKCEYNNGTTCVNPFASAESRERTYKWTEANYPATEWVI